MGPQIDTDQTQMEEGCFLICEDLCQSVAYSAMFLSFVHDIRGIPEAFGVSPFGCGGAALESLLF